MTTYRTLGDVIMAGLELQLKCGRCGYTERADPEDAKQYVGTMRRTHTAEPDFDIERCAVGLRCQCGAEDFKVDVINPITD